MAIGSIFCRDLGFGSRFRFWVEVRLLGNFFVEFWPLGPVLDIGWIFGIDLAFRWNFSFSIDFW